MNSSNFIIKTKLVATLDGNSYFDETSFGTKIKHVEYVAKKCVIFQNSPKDKCQEEKTMLELQGASYKISH